MKKKRESGPAIVDTGREAVLTESAPTTLDEMAILMEKVAQADEYLDLLKRAKADFENYKKRIQQERLEFTQFANEELIRDLLPVLDNFERAINHSGKQVDLEAVVSGIRLVKKDFEEVLKKRGLQRVEAFGLPFDPKIHEAVAERESSEYPDQTVIEELQTGYRLGERLLRPTQVVVSMKVEIEDREEKREEEESEIQSLESEEELKYGQGNWN